MHTMRAPPAAADAFTQYSSGLALPLRVNPVDCVARGLCPELLSGWVGLDDWRYSIVGDGELPLELVDDARPAAQACSTLALESDRE